MKIIHLVLGKANPERMNGVNKVAHKLATVQCDLGFDVCLWGISNDLIHNYPARNYKTQLFQQQKFYWGLDQGLLSAIAELPKDTVFHFHGVFIREFSLLAKQLKKLSISYIVTPHGALAKAAMKRSWMKKKIYFQLFEKYFLQNALAVHVLGKSGFDHLGSLLPDCRKVIIPNGQDLDELPKMDRVINLYIRFVFCGRLDQQHKGLDLMLKGFGKYLKNGGTGQLDLIGDGADAVVLKQLAIDEQITESVCFHGAKYGMEKWELINRGDVFMHTSRMEGFPIAVVEAAGLALPCIVSEATNIASYIREAQAGIALGENTPKQIAEAMSQMELLFRKNELRELGRHAQQMIATTFNWQEIAKNLFQLCAGASNENLQTSKKAEVQVTKEHVR